MGMRSATRCGRSGHRKYSNNASRSTSYGSSCRKPVNAADAMDIRLTNFFQLIVLLATVPFVFVFLAVDSYARKARRRTYYAREKERRIELADGRRMRLCEYAGIEDVIEGEDGKFYVVDREEYKRRMRLALDRRRIRKHTTMNKMPTPEELRAQWLRVKESHEEMLRFGSMLCDLEAYVDNSLRRDKNGNIQGRNPGIKGWLGFHCHDIYRKYKTAMRYKQMAVKARQIIDMPEPYPLTVALGDEIKGAEETTAGMDAVQCDNETSVGTMSDNVKTGREDNQAGQSRRDEGQYQLESGKCHRDGIGNETFVGTIRNETSVGTIGKEGCKRNGVLGGGRVSAEVVTEWRRKIRRLIGDSFDMDYSAQRNMNVRVGSCGSRGIADHFGGVVCAAGDVASECGGSCVTCKALFSTLDGRLHANQASVCFVNDGIPGVDADANMLA